MVHRTYDPHRHSPLDDINAGNVDGMHLAFAVPLGGSEPSAFGTGAFEGTPLVKDGRMYVAPSRQTVPTYKSHQPRAGSPPRFLRSWRWPHSRRSIC
jgi:glucose dehydrogenase